jgi:hypothetical protein
VSGRRGIVAFAVAAALGWALLPVLWPAWGRAATEASGKDFASYYYAVRAALAGDDPWSRVVLTALARADDTRRGVHPFLYPPPFLLVTAWIGRFQLDVAYRLWFWLDTAASVLAGATLWASVRRTSPLAAPAVALVLGGLTALPNNHLMGQANLLPLLLVTAGFWAEEEEQPVLAGVLVGTAAMLKMSPALLVFLWLAQRRWRAVGGAVGAAVALSLATLPLVDLPTQLRFYTDILPTFASGGYNGLAVPIDLFGNHSIPNLVDHWFPGTPAGLSATGRAVSTTLALVLLGALCWRYRVVPADPLDRAIARGAVLVLGLLVPVYTYEHHLVFAVPGVVALAVAVERGRVPPALAAVLGAAVSVVLFDLDLIKRAQGVWKGTPLGDLLLEAKSLALIGLFALSLRRSP